MPLAQLDSTYEVQLEVFEGPLDLLLHLIRTQELDIYDIPMAQIADQYLSYLDLMKNLNINLAGEYLMMAATLIFIKSRTLLPEDPDQADEDGIEDPRQELVEQLLEHEKFKKAAQLLYSRQTVENSVWPRGMEEFEDEDQESVSATVFDLIKTFHLMVERFKEQVVLEVRRETTTVEEKLAEIRRLLQVEKEFLFSFFFRHKPTRFHLVVTFLALLELVRLREVRLLQKGVFQDIRVVSC